MGLKYNDLIEIRLYQIGKAMEQKSENDLNNALNYMSSALTIFPKIRKEYEDFIGLTKNQRKIFNKKIQERYTNVDDDIVKHYQDIRIDEYFKRLAEGICQILSKYKLISEKDKNHNL